MQKVCRVKRENSTKSKWQNLAKVRAMAKEKQAGRYALPAKTSRGDWIRTSDPLLPKETDVVAISPFTCGFVIRVLPKVYQLIWGFTSRMAKDGKRDSVGFGGLDDELEPIGHTRCRLGHVGREVVTALDRLGVAVVERVQRVGHASLGHHRDVRVAHLG